MTRHFLHVHGVNKDQKHVDIRTYPCPDSTCGSRPFKRKHQLHVHLRDVHDRKSQYGKGAGIDIKKRRTSVQAHKFAFTTGHDLENVTSLNEDEDILRDVRSIHDKAQEAIPLFNLETVDPTVWNDDFEEPSTSVPFGIPFNLGVQDLDADLGLQMLEEGADMIGLLGRSDDETKYKMISAIRDKYAELRRIDEQISILEKLKVSRSNVSQDIAGLEGSYQELIAGFRHGIEY